MNPQQRFSKARPCPICGGFEQRPRGVGERCYGFFSADGRFAHCTREESAGALKRNPACKTFAHRLGGPCGCGQMHSRERPSLAGGSEGRRLVATWDYYSPDGIEKLFQVCRFETPAGKAYCVRRPAPAGWESCEHREQCRKDRVTCADGWISTLKARPCSPGVEPVLYNQALLHAEELSDEAIHAPEGERCADALGELGLLAVTNPFGAGPGKWPARFSDQLTGWHVVAYADADEPGRAFAQEKAWSLWGKAASIKVLDLYPDRNDGPDVADWIVERKAAGQDDESIRAELEALVAQAPEWQPAPSDGPPTSLPTKGSPVGSEVSGPDRLGGISLAALRRRSAENPLTADPLPLLGQTEPPILQRRLSHIVAAPPKGGKTTLLYAQATEWAQAGIVVLFISEEPEIVWSLRLQGDEAEDAVLERITLLPALGESPDALLDRMSRGSEEIVILDTTKILGVEDENDAATVNRVITPWVVKAREGAKTFVATHHLRKSGGRAVEALAGSYSWGALFDTVVEIELDEQDSRRELRAVGRLLPSCRLLYELRDGELALLGSPEEVELEGTKERVLGELTGEWLTTAQVHGALGDPEPSQEQVRRALNSLAATGQVEREPPWSEGSRQGATYRWRMPGSLTSLPTATCLVGSEVGGSDQGAVPMAPTAGGQ